MGRAWCSSPIATDLYWKPADGSGTAERLTEGDETRSPVSWSPVGRILAFQRTPEKYNSDLWLLPMDGAREPKPFYAERAEACYSEIERILRVHHAHKTSEMLEDEEAFRPEDRFTEKDIVAITYPDQLIKPGVPPLAFLGQLLNIYLTGIINTIHILPFYPYSSDRGFSVIDYRQVDPRMGTWDDIERLSLSFHLMFDGVINHVSSKSERFEEFLNGNPEYEDFFTVFDTTHELTEEPTVFP